MAKFLATSLWYNKFFTSNVFNLATFLEILLILLPSDTIRAKLSLTLQNSRPSKDNLSMDERKALKELQSDTSIVIVPADRGSYEQWSVSIT